MSVVSKWIFLGLFARHWFHSRDSKKWSCVDKHHLQFFMVCSTAVASSSEVPSTRQIFTMWWILHLSNPFLQHFGLYLARKLCKTSFIQTETVKQLPQRQRFIHLTVMKIVITCYVHFNRHLWSVLQLHGYWQMYCQAETLYWPGTYQGWQVKWRGWEGGGGKLLKFSQSGHPFF